MTSNVWQPDLGASGLALVGAGGSAARTTPSGWRPSRRERLGARLRALVARAAEAWPRTDDVASAHAQTLAWQRAAAAARAAALRAPVQRAASAPAVAIAPRGELAWIEAELDGLPSEARLVPHERFLVATARAPQIPALLREIGRLREITFRAAGEGTGRALDLDAYDRSYDHLFVWDRRERALAGAYRLASTERILPVFGVEGLYTSTLFRYAPGFFERLGPAIELGRSFVQPEYQRSSVALLLLWKAIARFVASQPRAHRLFGPVSLSADYTEWSRAATARLLTATRGDPALARFVAPRSPLLAPSLPRITRAGHALGEAKALSALIEEAEPTGRGLPVLVREYVKLGGRFLAWNVDADFADALDGLVVVDLLRTERRLLEFYMGKAEAVAFVARHAAGAR